MPFCQCLCSYCDFVKGPYREELADAWLEALEAECRLRCEEFRLLCAPRTFYAGGGTPTCLLPRQLERLWAILGRHFDLRRADELTFEANPGFVDAERFGLLRAFGVNRLSMGLQSTRAQTLRTLGRIHSGPEARQAVRTAREAGFRNLSLDLIFGVPGTDVEDVAADCRFVEALEVEHVSVYGLTWEPGTPLGEALGAGRIARLEESLERAQYRWLIDFWRSRGYEHYEVSNFAKPSFASRHNRGYWRNGAYIGLGPGAVSHLGGVRSANVRDTDEYISTLARGRRPLDYEEKLEGLQKAAETLMLGLRDLSSGVDLGEFERRTGVEPRRQWAAELAELSEAGLIEVRDGRLRLTSEGLMLLDSVAEHFMVADGFART